MKAICAGSQENLEGNETLHCTCGRTWKGPVSVPVHDEKGHVIPLERLAKSIDAGLATFLSRQQTKKELDGGPRMFRRRR